MLNHTRTLLAALFMGLFLVACDNNSDDTTAEQPSKDTAAEQAAPAKTETASNDDATDNQTTADAANADSVIGMTPEEVEAKWGKPALTQSHSLDSLEIIHSEWKTKDGIVAVQFHGGKAKFSQFVPAK